MRKNKRLSNFNKAAFAELKQCYDFDIDKISSILNCISTLSNCSRKVQLLEDKELNDDWYVYIGGVEVWESTPKKAAIKAMKYFME